MEKMANDLNFPKHVFSKQTYWDLQACYDKENKM